MGQVSHTWITRADMRPSESAAGHRQRMERVLRAVEDVAQRPVIEAEWLAIFLILGRRLAGIVVTESFTRVCAPL